MCCGMEGPFITSPAHVRVSWLFRVSWLWLQLLWLFRLDRWLPMPAPVVSCQICSWPAPCTASTSRHTRTNTRFCSTRLFGRWPWWPHRRHPPPDGASAEEIWAGGRVSSTTETCFSSRRDAGSGTYVPFAAPLPFYDSHDNLNDSCKPSFSGSGFAHKDQLHAALGIKRHPSACAGWRRLQRPCGRDPSRSAPRSSCGACGCTGLETIPGSHTLPGQVPLVRKKLVLEGDCNII